MKKCNGERVSVRERRKETRQTNIQEYFINFQT